MKADFLVNVAGWTGALLLLLAYLLVSSRKLAGDSLIYQLLNLAGSLFLLLNAYHFGALPSVGVNSVWIGIALFTIIKGRKTEKRED
ncbi:MAG: CBU_0592 family membrane protein [Candidatus Saccharicenans sp.]